MVSISCIYGRMSRLFLLVVVWMVLWSAHLLEAEPVSKNLLPDPDFKDTKAWYMPPGYRIEKSKGMEGQSALVAERSGSAIYQLAGTEVKVVPGRSYEFGAYVKGELTGSASICAELLDEKGQYLSGVYGRHQGGTFDWTLIQEVIPVPKGVRTCRLVLYLSQNTVGKAWFSKPYFRQTAGEFGAYFLDPVMATQIQTGRRSLTFGVFLPDETLHYACQITAWKEGKAFSTVHAAVNQNRVTCELDIPAGAFELRLDLLDKERSVGQAKIPSCGSVKIDERVAVRIDERGRTWVKGKKFFPIGLYLIHKFLTDEKRLPARDLIKDLDLIAEAPFNCVMPYDGLYWRSDLKATPGVAEVKKMLYQCQSRQLKVIFPYQFRPSAYDGVQGYQAVMKHVVTSLRTHPAILAWYVNDEDPVRLRSEFLERNTLINQWDPGHPTWAVFAIFNNTTSRYGGIATVYGVDPYPVKNTTENKSQSQVVQAMDAANQSFAHKKGMALWAVTQIFNWGVYDAQDNSKKFQTFRYPSETEMRSMALLQLIQGAKGIMMYSFFDLFTGPDPDQFEKRWPQVCRVAKLVSDLQEYILGDPVGPEVLKQVSAGEVRAAGFTHDNGQPVVLIASVGPGESKATIHVKTQHKLRSLFGRSIQHSNGRWLYTGHDIDSDVLVPVESKF